MFIRLQIGKAGRIQPLLKLGGGGGGVQPRLKRWGWGLDPTIPSKCIDRKKKGGFQPSDPLGLPSKVSNIKVAMLVEDVYQCKHYPDNILAIY